MKPPPEYAAVLKKHIHQLAVGEITKFVSDFQDQI
jgi:hypothetical protein